MPHKTEERLDVHVRIATETADQLKRMAASQDCSVPQLIRTILAQWVRDHTLKTHPMLTLLSLL